MYIHILFFTITVVKYFILSYTLIYKRRCANEIGTHSKSAKKDRPKARARRKGGVGGIPPRPSRSEAPPPRSFRAEFRKKVFFFLLKEKEIARQIKKCEENFFAEQRAAAGRSVSSVQNGFGFRQTNAPERKFCVILLKII